jgi:myo-inositol catabolism protein IolS
MSMEYVRLGATDLQVSRIGFGCAPMGGYDYGEVSDRQSIRAVRKALDLGINFFDTADIYGLGHAEEVLGRALGAKRHDVTISTKFGLVRDSAGSIVRDCAPERVVRALEGSLRRLKVDAISLYQVHWVDFATPLEDTIGALLECQREGKVRHIGLCNVDSEFVKRIRNSCSITGVQSSYNLVNRGAEQDLLPYCFVSEIAFVSHSPLARGLLTGKYRHNHRFTGTDTRRGSRYFSSDMTGEKQSVLSTLKQISLLTGHSCAQVALRWILDNRNITALVVGLKSLEQVTEGVGTLGWKLQPIHYQSLCEQSSVFTTPCLY